MNFGFSEEQEMIKEMVRDFGETECPKSLVREMEKDEKGYSPDLWKKMADLGWMGLVYPEKYGGSGLTFVDFTTLLEEMGKMLVPGPFIPAVVCSGHAILKYGSAAHKKECVRKRRVSYVAISQRAQTAPRQS